jgi:hypothetical protein
MQIPVIPVKLTFGSFVGTMCVLMAVMFSIQWSMRVWSSWEIDFFLRKKLKKMVGHHQKVASHRTESESDIDDPPVTPPYRGGIDLDRDALEMQTLGARDLASRKDEMLV